MKFAHIRRLAALGVVLTGAAAACKADLGLSIDFSLEGQTMTIEAFTELTAATGGKLFQSTGTGDMAALAGQAMTDGLVPGAAVDIAFVVDTTGSMGDDIDAVKAKLSDLVSDLASQNPDWQVGVAEYRDIGDPFIAQLVQPLTPDEPLVQAGIAALDVDGGGDYCEHVYQGLDTAIADFAWRVGSHHRIVLIGDAPPHRYAGDPHTFDSVIAAANADDVQINAVVPECDAICAALVQLLGGGSCD
ncbi:MAG: VWA domain-containing protein [Myxococcales bacterium]|nr:VWA domain-containing protein [Myxococcales bacterium]